MKNKFPVKSLVLLFLLLIIYILISAFSYTNAVCLNIADSVFRLHVIANSNSTEDQNLKYIIRDKILEYVSTISQDANSKEELINIMSKHLTEIEDIAEQTILEEGYNYDVTISIGNFSFPTKQYGDIMLPPGYYDALRVEIGEAKGENWWCVMFPPLCFVDVSSGIVPEDSKEILETNLSTEEYKLISENGNKPTVKFKIVEVLQNLSISGIFM